MKRWIACLTVVGVLIGALCVPAMALGLLAQPPDGQKVALTNWSELIYEYPVGSGTWYFDGITGNYTTDSGPLYYEPPGSSVTLVDPHITVEYRTAADAVLGRETIAINANVISAYGAADGASYRTFHHRLTLPAGADPLRTRSAPEVSPSDPEFPKYHFATANRTALYQEIDAVWGTIDDTTLGGGRIQRTLTVTNITGELVGPIRIAGRETYGPGGSPPTLNSYDVTPDDPAKALLLGDGESTTFTLRGFAVAPVLPRTPANSWIEAETPSLIGTVTWAGLPLPGVTVTPWGNYTPMTTIANGQYAKVGLVGVPGGNGITFSKPGYDSQTHWTTIGGATTTLNTAMTITPSLTRSPTGSSKTYKRKRGRAKYTLGATVKGAGAIPMAGIRVRLQRSANGRTKWKTAGTYTSNSAGKVAKSFSSKRRSTYYYRWVVLSQSGVNGTPKTIKQKVRVK